MFKQGAEMRMTKCDSVSFESSTMAVPSSCLGYFPGEKIYYEWTVGKKTGKFEITPYPLHFESQDKTIAVDFELMNAFTGTFAVKFSGLQEKEMIHMISQSWGEVVKADFPSDQTVVYSCGVNNKNGGVAKVLFKTRSGNEINAKIPWGDELIKLSINPAPEK